MTICRVEELMLDHGGVITTKEVKEHGIATWYLTKLVREGMIERRERGVYCASSFEDDLFLFQKTHPRCVYSHQTALYLLGLCHKKDDKPHVSVCHGYNDWRMKTKVTTHQLKQEWYDLGIVEVKSEHGNLLRVYNAERTLCDLLRSGDMQLIAEAFWAYSHYEQRNISRLRKYARKFGISKLLNQMMGVMFVE